ncbi:Rap1a/Tai family immunity protein [Alisedimentitalea sp. MJ-SS2]|uniref:Rap1a/Tai family immunity protein n=1 Tax=Aliisedimentitalea sp. MJ-SS2 TaxID=3049795 RepID=UPI0029120D63|nr:Rap1a/Tai family immunity protein [Alisedimentitalea sp. MJ-SS2]MDU8929962.1 Rap1a/Tai family immunity protein [Alisedimentitalea sp. MJ-SS2]
MRSALLIASMAFAALASPGHADVYTAGDLLSPCQEADNDARWGEAAETECEQYIMGFVGALKMTGAKESMGICAPDQNTADEVRWAFMRWVHASYSERKAMPANEALLATLKDEFACQ